MTTPVTPAVPSEIAKIEGFIFDKTHLILAVVLIAALLSGVYLFESKRADAAEAKAEIATQVLKVAQKVAEDSAVQNAVQQTQSKALEEQMAEANTRLATANAQLQAANKQLATALAAQQKNDATLTPPAQAQRWEQLVPTAKVIVTSTGFAVDPQGGLDTLQALEELPFDRQLITNLNKTITNDEATIVNDAVSLAVEKKAHQSDNDNNLKQLTATNDATKKVQGDFDTYKTKAHRNFFKTVGICIGIGIGVGAHFF